MLAARHAAHDHQCRSLAPGSALTTAGQLRSGAATRDQRGRPLLHQRVWIYFARKAICKVLLFFSAVSDRAKTFGALFNTPPVPKVSRFKCRNVLTLFHTLRDVTRGYTRSATLVVPAGSRGPVHYTGYTCNVVGWTDRSAWTDAARLRGSADATQSHAKHTRRKP